MKRSEFEYVESEIIPEDIEDRPAPCADCGKETEPRAAHDGRPLFKYWDAYLVRQEVWEAAGMGGEYGSGFLCTPCLEKRLGRSLADGDYMVRTVRATSRALTQRFSSGYFDWKHTPADVKALKGVK